MGSDTTTMLHDLTEQGGQSRGTGESQERDRRLDFLATMLRIRAFEERVHRMYVGQQLFGMSPHLSCGQEAMATGVGSALRVDDYIVSTHRGHGHCIAKGAAMRPMLAELCGKQTGYCKGRGGTMHIADFRIGIVGANGIVGGGLPIATGVGLSIKYRGTDQVCVVFFGDAASNQGTFHEAVNFCCAFKLPVVFVCENNLYGLSTPYARVSASPDVADRAVGYRMPGGRIDGNDVVKVFEETTRAVRQARAGGGPSLIEGKTYRYYGHSASDHRPYRTRAEEEDWRTNRDPILRLQRTLVAEDLLQEEDFHQMEAAALGEADDAAEYALASPDPDPREATMYVYSEGGD